MDERVVKPNNIKKQEIFVIIDNPKKKILYAIRRQKDTLNKTINKYLNENEDAIELFRIDNPIINK